MSRAALLKTLFEELELSADGPILQDFEKFTIDMNGATKESLDDGLAKIKAYNGSLLKLGMEGRELLMDCIVMKSSEALKMRAEYAEWLAKVSPHIAYPGTFIGEVFTNDKGFQRLLKQSDEAGVKLRQKIVDALKFVRPIEYDSTEVVDPNTGSFVYLYLPIDELKIPMDLEYSYNFKPVMTTVEEAMGDFTSARKQLALAARYFLKGKNEPDVEIPTCLVTANDLASGKVPKAQPWETAASSSSTGAGNNEFDLKSRMARFALQTELLVIVDDSADMGPDLDVTGPGFVNTTLLNDMMNVLRESFLKEA